MNDYINRHAAIDGKISIQRTNGVEIYTDEAVPVAHLKNVPAADVAPVIHGKWGDKEVIHKKCIEEWQSARCSACGKYHTTPYMYYFDDFKFCPNCCAKMDGNEEGELQ